MISLRGIAISLIIHGVAATAISVSAAIRTETPAEDVAAIPVELILEMEAAPVAPAAPVEEIIEAAPVEDVVEPKPVEEVVEAKPVPTGKVVEPALEIKTASLPPPVVPPFLEPEPVTEQESPVKIPPVVETKPLAKATVQNPEPKIIKEKPRRIAVQKPAAKKLQSSQRKQVATLAAGKGSIGQKRSTDGRAAEQSYNSKVLARLRAAKKYPAAARGKGIEGTAILAFTISSSGSLTSARVVKGAGHALLDIAVIAMARDAAPFPAFPQAITKNQMSFRVPVQFKIN